MKKITSGLEADFCGQTTALFTIEACLHEDGIRRARLQVQKVALHLFGIFSH